MTDKKNDKRPCVRCQRIRWVLTLVMLGSMLAVLYLNEFAG